MSIKEYISDKIGEDYKQWRPNSVIYIKSPTGSGKTSFIFDVLLKYAISENRKILYLVNREVLRKQLCQKINNIDLCRQAELATSIKDYIDIVTYQHIENAMYNNINIYKEYYYIICDEAHYFLSDSLFNSRTQVSYEFIAQYLYRNTVIFMSATIERFEKVLNNVEDNRRSKNSIKEFYPGQKSRQLIGKTYEGDKDYTYVKATYFRAVDDIPIIIEKERSNTKWMIFINDIKKGKSICNALKAKKIDAVFIDSSYEKDENAKVNIDNIVEKGEMNHRVTIATSVLDNGISIDDNKLRNMIILAENEIEFTQMLGRKRVDDEELNLYLCLRSKKEFVERLYYANKANEKFQLCMKLFRNNEFDKIVKEMLLQQETYNYFKKLIYIENCLSLKLGINAFVLAEMAEDIMNYNSIINKFDTEGDKAFLKIQLSWLGKTEEEVEEIILNGIEEEKTQLLQQLEEIINEKVNVSLDRSGNMQWKEKLIPILNKIEHAIELKEGIPSGMKKNDRPISERDFNKCMISLGLKYHMIRKKNGKGKDYLYTVKR